MSDSTDRLPSYWKGSAHERQVRDVRKDVSGLPTIADPKALSSGSVRAKAEGKVLSLGGIHRCKGAESSPSLTQTTQTTQASLAEIQVGSRSKSFSSSNPAHSISCSKESASRPSLATSSQKPPPISEEASPKAGNFHF